MRLLNFIGKKSKRNIAANLEKKDRKLAFEPKYHKKSSRDLIKRYGVKMRPKSSYCRYTNRTNKSYAVNQMK